MNARQRTAVVIIFIACPSNVSWIADAREVIDFIKAATLVEKRLTINPQLEEDIDKITTKAGKL